MGLAGQTRPFDTLFSLYYILLPIHRDLHLVMQPILIRTLFSLSSREGAGLRDYPGACMEGSSSID